jgi:hypothetical protein
MARMMLPRVPAECVREVVSHYLDQFWQLTLHLLQMEVSGHGEQECVRQTVKNVDVLPESVLLGFWVVS